MLLQTAVLKKPAGLKNVTYSGTKFILITHLIEISMCLCSAPVLPVLTLPPSEIFVHKATGSNPAVNLNAHFVSTAQSYPITYFVCRVGRETVLRISIRNRGVNTSLCTEFLLPFVKLRR